MEMKLYQVHFKNAKVLDVGSLDINGSYKPLITQRGWEYIGLDLVQGKNVDVVSKDPFRYPFQDCEFDIVISGSTMEHVTRIWDWIPELVRILKPKGYLVIITHWSFPLHRYPLDCWRIMPDGFRYLFEMTGKLEHYAIHIANETDIVASAFKKEN